MPYLTTIQDGVEISRNRFEWGETACGFFHPTEERFGLGSCDERQARLVLVCITGVGYTA